jgi:hypothetical protein
LTTRGPWLSKDAAAGRSWAPGLSDSDPSPQVTLA